MKKELLFTDNSPGHGTVVLNWHGVPEAEFKYFAEAFHRCAQDSVKVLAKEQHFGLDGCPLEDFRAYPVVFLYRHALELFMKAAIFIGSPMLAMKGYPITDKGRLLKEHSLEVLRQDIERLFTAYGWKWDLGIANFKTVDDFRKVIGEIQAIDSGSYAFRYPVDTKGCAALPSGFRFNLFEFSAVLDRLLLAFGSLASAAHEELQTSQEAMAEASQCRRENSDGEM